MPEVSSPSGVEGLCHPKSMQTYLSLLGSSQKDATLEACCGALQNLTASKGIVSTKKMITQLTVCVWRQRALGITLDSFIKVEKRQTLRWGGK